MVLSGDATRLITGQQWFIWLLFRLGGRVQVYERSSSKGYRLLQSPFRSNLRGEVFGDAVAMSGDGTTIAANSYSWSSHYKELVRVYRWDPKGSREWRQLGSDLLHPLSQFSRDHFGFGRFLKLSRDGNILLVRSSRSVDVFAFDASTNQWNSLGQTIYSHSIHPISGYGRLTSATLSGDGRVVATREQLSIDTLGLFNPHPEGSVRLFQLSNKTNTWEQVGNTLGDDFTNDGLGNLLYLSESGSRIAVSKSMGGDGRMNVFQASISCSSLPLTVNARPTLIVEGVSKTILIGESASIRISAIDADGDTIYMTILKSYGSFSLLDVSNGESILVFNGSNTTGSSFQAWVTVSDGTSSILFTGSIEVVVARKDSSDDEKEDNNDCWFILCYLEGFLKLLLNLFGM